MTERDEALCWRAERALQMAWPALEEQRCGDWLARFAPGVSRRSNSANPMSVAFGALDADIAACEAAYHERGQPAIFRTPAIVEARADEALARRGYLKEGETVTLYAELATDGVHDLAIEIERRPSAAWLAAIGQLQGHTPDQARVYRRVVESIAIPAGFAILREGREAAALAFGAIDDRLLCCESVIANPRLRGRGYATRMMKALLAWGAEQGARDACLQVAADNAPGLALYRSLGMMRELYRYHYWRETAG
jgi:ribosomal protein S18 acetylase RimI-like enzyme